MANLLKVNVWLKEPVEVNAGRSRKLGMDEVFMTTSQLSQYTGGPFHATCIKTGKHLIIPEHQIGYIQADPVDEGV